MIPKLCGHGKTFDEPCDYCEIVGLNETIENFTRIVERAKSKLDIINSRLMVSRTNDAAEKSKDERSARKNQRLPRFKSR